MTEPTPSTIRRTTFTLTIKGVAVRVVCGARLPRLIGKKGITLGHTIYLAPDPLGVTPGLLAHEFAHVLQWRMRGGWVFVGQYLRGLIRHGYGLSHPLERNAHDYAVAYQQDFLLSVQLMQALS